MKNLSLIEATTDISFDGLNDNTAYTVKAEIVDIGQDSIENYVSETFSMGSFSTKKCTPPSKHIFSAKCSH
jgi:hypothetical protein